MDTTPEEMERMVKKYEIRRDYQNPQNLRVKKGIPADELELIKARKQAVLNYLYLVEKMESRKESAQYMKQAYKCKVCEYVAKDSHDLIKHVVEEAKGKSRDAMSHYQYALAYDLFEEYEEEE